MSVKLAWYHEPSIILIKLIGNVSPEDYHAAVNMVYDWMDASPAEKIHVIVDSRELLKLPTVLELSRSKVHQKPGVVVSFGVENKLLRSVAGLALQILKVEMRFVDTLEDALVFLRKVDAELGVLPVQEPDNYIEFDTIKQ